jgi:hypothetical protein
MKDVEIAGKKYSLMNADEVPYGAEKKLEAAQFEASLAMLSDSDVSQMVAARSKTGDNGINEEEFVDRVMSNDAKRALLDSHNAAITPEEEAIILSAGLSLKEILGMRGKEVRELAKLAMEEMGTVEDFSEASSSDTS